MDLALHFILFLSHFGLIVFNLTGWIWKKTRRIHLVTILVTILSWFGLGVFYGFGYCPLVDWQWDIKRRLGELNLPASFVKYYLDKWTGHSWDPVQVDHAVLFLGVTALVLSVVLNLLDRQKAGKNKAPTGCSGW